MCFDYEYYFKGCLIDPITVLCFSTCSITYLTALLIKSIKSFHEKKEDMFKYIAIIFIFLFMFSINFGRLAHGGIHLIGETETDSIEVSGNIEKIERIGRYSFPRIKTEYEYEETSGVQFTINGEKFTSIVQGEFEVGDFVTVDYLPKSRYILSIEGKTSQ